MREVNRKMRRKTLSRAALAAVLVASATMGVVAGASAQTPAGDQQVQSLDLRAANMVEALRILTAKTGVQFIIEPSADPFDKVTLQLGPISVEDALKYICQSAHAYYRRDESGVYIISKTKPEEPKPAVVLPTRKHTTVKKLKMMHADPRDVYERILDTNPVKGDMVFDTRVWQGMKDFASLAGKGQGMSGSPGVALMPQGNAASFPATNSQIPTPRTGVDSSANNITLPGESANQLGSGGGGGGFGGGGLGGGGFGGGGQGGGGFGGGGQGGGGFGQGGNINLVPGQGYVPNGITRITYDPTDNSLVVEGTEEAIDELRKLV